MNLDNEIIEKSFWTVIGLWTMRVILGKALIQYAIHLLDKLLEKIADKVIQRINQNKTKND